MKGRCLSLLFSLLCATTLMAQSVTWVIRPDFSMNSYTSIERISRDLYKATKNHLVGVINCKGEEVVPFLADSITTFVENKALILRRTIGGEHILMGILHDDQHGGYGYQTVSGGPYYIEDYPFFSEGYLIVWGESMFRKSRLCGYLDEKGELAIDLKYSSAKPFSEGLASVVETILGSTLTTYIDRYGRKLKIDKSVGSVVMASSFFNSEAIIRNSNGIYLYIDTNGRLLRERDGANLDFDWKGRVSKESLPSPLPKPDGPIPFCENGMWGYRNTNGSVLVPPQFYMADPFISGNARVSISYSDSTNVTVFRPGILRLVDGCVTLTQEFGTMTEKSRNKEPVHFVCKLPNALSNKVIALDVISGSNKQRELIVSKGTAGECQMSLPIQPRNVKLSIEGICYLDEVFSPVMAYDQITVSVTSLSKRADKNGNFYFEIVFANRGSHDVMVPIAVRGRSLVCKVVSPILIQGGTTCRIKGYFTKVNTQREVRTIIVEYGDKTVSKSVQVIPIIG